MSKTPFMPVAISDFIADTLHLDATETGAYWLLLMAQWKRAGASLPDDHTKLQRIAKCARSWPRVWQNISPFFERDDDGWFNRKGREVYANVAKSRIANEQNGARGGAAKALKYKQLTLAKATIPPKPNAYQLELEEEEEKREAIASPKKTTTGHRLSAMWFLPREWGEWAVDQGLSSEAVRLQADQFKDYWVSLPGAKGRKLDWQATWRNWIRKAVEDSHAARGRNNGTSDKQRFGENVHRLADGLSAGTVQFGTDDRNPFTARSGGDT